MDAGHHVLGMARFSSFQNQKIYIMTIVVGIVSILTAIITIYWFAMMRRNFRQQLVLCLILAELFKSCMIMISSSALLALKKSADTDFCQAGGFFLQVGVEACDIGVFFISIHTTLQVFYSTTRTFGQSGLYRFRYAVLILWVVLPVLAASLAFTNPTGRAYVMQSSFCGLPIRPHWYGLALSWVPRYLIMTYVLCVAICIYRHVRVQLKDDTSIVEDQAATRVSQYHRDMTRLQQLYEKSGRPMPLPAISDPSHFTDTTVCGNIYGDSCIAPPSPCYTGVEYDRKSSMSMVELPRSRQQSIEDINSPRIRIIGPMLISPVDRTVAEDWNTTTKDKNLMVSIEENKTSPASSHKQRQESIRREVRLIFVYPIVYLLGWLIPLIDHSLSYSDHYAKHPIYILSALSTFSLNVLPIVDCIIFAWREQPFRQIPGSDGSFWGSFAFWTFGEDVSAPLPSTIQTINAADSSLVTWFDQGLATSTQNRKSISFDQAPASPRSRMGSFQPLIIKKNRHSAQSERELHEAQWAHQRLMLEQADRRSTSFSRKGSAVSGHEWWERPVSEVLRVPISEEAF